MTGPGRPLPADEEQPRPGKVESADRVALSIWLQEIDKLVASQTRRRRPTRRDA